MSTRIIKINRGDSFEFTAFTNGRVLKATDALYFAVLLPHQNFEDALILKGYRGSDEEVNNEAGEVNIKLTPNETKRLLPGIYYYTTKIHVGGSLEDLGVSTEPDEVCTMIERTKFIVNE